MWRPLLLLPLLLTACAPAADLQTPVPTESSAISSLVLIRLQDVEAEDELEDRAGFAGLTDHPPAFWNHLREALEARFDVGTVAYSETPSESPFDSLRVLSQRMTPSGQPGGWERVDIRIARTPDRLSPLAEVVVVLDRPEVVLARHVATQIPHDVLATALVSVYSEGQVAWAGRVQGRGDRSLVSDPLPRDARVDWERAVVSLAEQIGTVAALRRR